GKTAIDLGIVVTGGPNIPGIGDAVIGTLTAHWDNSWAIGLIGDVKVFTWAGANGDLTLSAHSDLIGTLHLTGLNGVFSGDGRMHVWNDNGTALITGDAMVSVQIPAGALLHQCVLAVCISVPPTTIQGPSASAQFGRFQTPDAPDVYGLKGQTTFGTWQPAVFVAPDSNVRFDFGGLQQYRLVDQTSGGGAGAQRSTVADAVYPVSVGTATPTLIVALGRDSGTPSLTLTDPTNRVITATTSDPAISYTTTATQTIFTIAHPPTGNWTVTVGNLSGGEHYLLDVVGAPLAAAITQPPTLTANGSGVAPRASGAAYTITTQVSGAIGSTYALYYDTDTSGADGTPIATGIPITQMQVNWDTSTVPNGTYYIYAVLDDPTNAPVVAYNATPITINDSTPPPVPTNLQVSTSGSDGLVTWQPSSARDIAGYHITYQQPNGGQTFVTDVPSGQQGSYTQHGLYLNGTWQIAISAYDLNSNESAPSSTVAAPISAVSTFALAASAGGSATVSPPGTTFAPGSVLTLTATPAPGSVFVNWTIDGGDGGSATPLSFTTTGNHSVVANFIPFTVAGTTPTSGSTRGGSTVTIRGAGFLPGVTVSFGNTSATVVSATETAIIVTTPAHDSGAVDVVVTSGGQHATLSQGDTYGDVSALPTAQPTAPPVGGTPAPAPAPRPSVAPPGGGIASPNPLPPHR
ncbi:MAG: IPT/TIG domain-containing protein, partial [Thermomicrobia bacterium]|nr:IPT/TIG domain-containing protein [Thermomicrobia bacterium]